MAGKGLGRWGTGLFLLLVVPALQREIAHADSGAPDTDEEAIFPGFSLSLSGGAHSGATLRRLADFGGGLESVGEIPLAAGFFGRFGGEYLAAEWIAVGAAGDVYLSRVDTNRSGDAGSYAVAASVEFLLGPRWMQVRPGASIGWQVVTAEPTDSRPEMARGELSLEVGTSHFAHFNPFLEVGASYARSGNPFNTRVGIHQRIRFVYVAIGLDIGGY